MLFKAMFLLLAHASLFFGAVLSGALLSQSLATHRPLDFWTWSFYGAMIIVEIVLAGMHVLHHIPLESIAPSSTAQIPSRSQRPPLRPTELAESHRQSNSNFDKAASSPVQMRTLAHSPALNRLDGEVDDNVWNAFCMKIAAVIGYPLLMSGARDLGGKWMNVSTKILFNKIRQFPQIERTEQTVVVTIKWYAPIGM